MMYCESSAERALGAVSATIRPLIECGPREVVTSTSCCCEAVDDCAKADVAEQTIASEHAAALAENSVLRFMNTPSTEYPGFQQVNGLLAKVYDGWMRTR